MTFLYDARYSIILLRPKNELKLLTQSALGQICIGKWRVQSLAKLFLRLQKGRRLKKIEHGRTRGRGRKISKNRIERSNFRRFSAVWALLLKIQSAITPSILGVRGSSSDSRKLSPIPFNNMPNQA